MEVHTINLVLFASFFLILTGLLLKLTQKITAIPYTVALLVSGIIGGFAVEYFQLPIQLSLSADVIYFILLPLLLFESAMHINFHQFKLQFKTITFFATFGLLLSVFTVAYTLALLIGYPIGVALLFGAIISSTDPIAVISLFKTLGAPKRLGLVADGESMLNDATGVIVFRIISGFVVTNAAFQSQAVFSSLGNFLYVFIGSIVFGAVVGYIFSKLIERIQNDRVVETTLTVAAALGSFAAAEHFFHLSGVITTVITGLVVGNLGRTKFSPGVEEFVEELWEYFAYLSVSLVFFFATFNLDFGIFSRNPQNILAAVFAVLLGRAVSIYASAFVTNRVSFFKDEPNIPMSWQHILNWGGLRGVIPLVLVYSLPETYEYRDDMLSFTLGALLFTLFVNGLTIRTLLLKLGLHLPRREEEIIQEEESIFALEEAKNKLMSIPPQEVDKAIINSITKSLDLEEHRHKKHLLKIAQPKELVDSLRLYAIAVERKSLNDLYYKGYISEVIFNDFDVELDLQQDALEYPEVYAGGAVTKEGKVRAGASFRKSLRAFNQTLGKMPLVAKFFSISEESIIYDRVALLKARLLTSEAVLDYLRRLENIVTGSKKVQKAINEVCIEHEKLIVDNTKDLHVLTKKYPTIMKSYQENLAKSFIRLPKGH